MFTFTPNYEFYATQTNANYADLIKTIRGIYCGKALRVEDGIVTALPYKAGRAAKVIGTITKS